MPGPFSRAGAVRVRQHDATDCGAACLQSVAAHHGRRLPIARIRQYASTDREGTNVLGMVEAAERLGFTARGVKGTFACLSRIPFPAIAHVVVAGTLQHFVVLCSVTPSRVVVMDPGDGRLHRLSHAEFREQWTGVLVLLAPGERFRPGCETTRPIRRFWALVRPHRTVMVQALVGAAVCTLLGLSTAVYVQKLMDHVIVDGNRNLLNLLSAVMLALVAAQGFVGWMKDLLALRTGQRIDAALILGYYRHLLCLPQRFFDTMRVGEITSRVSDAVKIRAFINDAALDLTVNAMVILLSLAAMLLYSWRLACVMLAALPLYGLVYWITNRLNRATERRMMESAADLESQLVESLNAVATIKRFGLEAHANLQTETRFVRLLRPVYRSGLTDLFAGNASDLLSRLATLALLWVGAGLVISRALSPGELMSFYALGGYLTGPVSSLIAANRTVQDALIAADRLFEIMDLEREERGERSVELAREMVGDVRFERVGFRYGTRPPVFTDLDLEVPRGRLTAVVGESGSGKSTLLALIQGLYPIQSGRVCIGQVDLRHANTGSLRRLVSVVPQRVDLFAGSVIDNVAVGEFEPDVQRVLEICSELGVTEFVERLPQGFGTPLGENGATLSGGQRQRLAIARALYRDPEVLILDEATSSLDSASERYVLRAMRALRARGKTVLVVAHRLSTVMHADKIVVLSGGRVVEEGSHHSLMLREGAYYSLWRSQYPIAVAEEMTQPPQPEPAITVAGGGAEPGGVPDWLRAIRG